MTKKKQIKKNNQIDIRSEEVQEILGTIPPWIIRWGISLILFIILILFIGSWYFKYPEIVSIPINIHSYSNNKIVNYKHKYYGEIKMSEEYWGSIKENQKVKIKLKGYPYHNYGIIDGLILKKEEKQINKNYFLILVSLNNNLKTSYNTYIKYYKGMSGLAEIIIDEKRLLEKILYFMKKRL